MKRWVPRWRLGDRRWPDVEDGGGEEELCSSPPWLSLGMDAALARTAALYPGRLAPSPGQLFAWGKAGGKGGNALPVAASAVDKAGDCIYPAPVKVPKGTGAVFLKASVDVGPFCALDSSGGVWVWSGWSPERWPPTPARVLEGCIDCSAGSGFVVAAKADGSVWLLGKAPAPTPLPNASGGSWVELGWGAGEAPQAVAVEACEGVVLAANAEGALFTCGRGLTLGLAEKQVRQRLALTAEESRVSNLRWIAGSGGPHAAAGAAARLRIQRGLHPCRVRGARRLALHLGRRAVRHAGDRQADEGLARADGRCIVRCHNIAAVWVAFFSRQRYCC